MSFMRTACSVAATILLAACAPPPVFYTNAPVDARSATTAVSVREVDAENRTFRVYKVNDTLYALIPARAPTTSFINELNRALILSAAQHHSLVAAATLMSAAHDRRSTDDLSLILFELTENGTETLVRSSSVGTRVGLQTSGTAVEVNPIVFRLQLSEQGASRLISRQRIDYMYHGAVGSLSVADLRALIRDLSK